jgi:hypothetical protein
MLSRDVVGLPGWGMDGENRIPFPQSHHRHAFTTRTQTLNKLKRTSINETLFPAWTGIHHISTGQRPQEARQIAGPADGRHKPYGLFR